MFPGRHLERQLREGAGSEHAVPLLGAATMRIRRGTAECGEVEPRETTSILHRSHCHHLPLALSLILVAKTICASVSCAPSGCGTQHLTPVGLGFLMGVHRGHSQQWARGGRSLPSLGFEAIEVIRTRSGNVGGEALQSRKRGLSPRLWSIIVSRTMHKVGR